jgi:hypothetical protein
MTYPASLKKSFKEKKCTQYMDRSVKGRYILQNIALSFTHQILTTVFCKPYGTINK